MDDITFGEETKILILGLVNRLQSNTKLLSKIENEKYLSDSNFYIF
ncbi:MAG: hypothetical protein WCP85_29115 [Mariniphaga sp.]